MIKGRRNETETEEESGEKQKNTQREQTLCFLSSRHTATTHAQTYAYTQRPHFYHLSTAAACNTRYTHARTHAYTQKSNCLLYT